MGSSDEEDGEDGEIEDDDEGMEGIGILKPPHLFRYNIMTICPFCFTTLQAMNCASPMHISLTQL